MILVTTQKLRRLKEKRFKNWRRFGLAICSVWCLFAVCFLAACQPTPGKEESSPQDAGTSDIRCYTPAPGKPRISDISYQGQELLQPRKLLFRVLWSDSERDLAKGTYQFFWNGTPLEQSKMPEGELVGKSNGGVTLVLSLPADKKVIPQTEFTVGLQIEDAKGLRSNVVTMTLESHR